MKDAGIDVLIATSPLNITYFTDYHCWLDSRFREYMTAPGTSSDLLQSYSVFFCDDEPALVVDSVFAVNAADLWVKDLHLSGEHRIDRSLEWETTSELEKRFLQLLQSGRKVASPTGVLLEILTARKATGSVIGLEMDGLPARLKNEILTALPAADFRECSNLIRLIRMVKSQEELARIIRSAEISEAAATDSLSLAAPGLRTAELAQCYRSRVAAMGADFDHFAFGVRGLGIATETEYVLRPDDVLYVDFGCVYQRYFSDSGRTLAIGGLSKELTDKYLALQACVEAATRVMRPEVAASEVRDAMWAELKEYGVSESYPHGHGLGLEPRDYPIIVPHNGLRIRDGCLDVSSDQSLEAGMVINLESAIFAPPRASLHIEQTFLLTQDGNVPLIPQDRAKPFRSLGS